MIFLTVAALTEITYLPGSIHWFLRYANQLAPTSASEYWRHSYLISLGFLITPIIGYALMSKWLCRCGPEIEELLLPVSPQEDVKI